MILGVGTDLIEIRRMEKACKKDYFVVRTFTDMESRQAKGSASKLAGSFAVKEAVAKALGTGFRTFMPIDVEVLRDDMGKPMSAFTEGPLSGFRRWEWSAWRCPSPIQGNTPWRLQWEKEG